jgi:hypothetical protein
MATSVYGVPLINIEGETKTLSTTAGFVALEPGFHEVKMYCAAQWRLALVPKLARVKYYNATSYTDYTAQATDGSSSTHVPLDAMATTHYLYLGVTAPTRGFYFDIGSNPNAENRTLDFEYLYDCAKPGYFKITGTGSGTMTVGETVTETDAADAATGVTATLVYYNSAYIIIKDVSGGSPHLTTGYDWDGSAQSCNNVTAIDPVAPGTGYFTDVASDTDGTDSTGTLAIDGLYYFTLPSVVRGALTGIDGDPLYWYRFAPSGALSATVDINEIIPAYKNTNYGYMEPGMEYQFSINTTQCGGFEIAASSGTPTLDISWVLH